MTKCFCKEFKIASKIVWVDDCFINIYNTLNLKRKLILNFKNKIIESVPRFEPSAIRWLVQGANHCANIILH